MHNLGTVFRFEVIRTLKKKSFWIIAIAFPIAIGAIYGIVYFSNVSTEQAAQDTKNQKFSLVVTDESGLVNKSILEQIGATESSDKQSSINRVVNGELDAYFYYPKNLVDSQVEIYAADAGLFDNSRYQAVASVILQQSVVPNVDPQVTAILNNSVGFNSITYKNGTQFDSFKELLAPGLFLVLFYILIATFGNQMLSSTTEEKENRVIEIILTTIKARTLIIGKILSLLLLALIQVVVIIVPIFVVYLLFHDQLSLPTFDLNNIPLDPVRIGIGLAVFVTSFLLFTGLLVAIGSSAPTAKEASGFFGVVMILLFGPLYSATLFVSSPDSIIVRFLSFFPLTAPIPLMLRNAIGNLSVIDAIIGIAILGFSAVIALTIAVRIFQYGALEYSKRVSIIDIFRKH
jgi:ABC-2 type transport system permease protein